MEAYKQEFIGFLLKTGALKVGGDFTLKSGRSSPYFVNIGDFNDGVGTAQLGAAYAQAIKKSDADFDLLYGIPEKGVGLAIATAIELGRLGINKPWFCSQIFAGVTITYPFLLFFARSNHVCCCYGIKSYVTNFG